MSALDHPSLLTKLIIAGEAAVQMRHGLNPEALDDVVHLIKLESRAPIDRARVIGDAIVMCAEAVQAGDRQLRSHDRGAARPFVQVVGVLLPYVRTALEAAIEQRNRPTP
jgi:hypothetical protein